MAVEGVATTQLFPTGVANSDISNAALNRIVGASITAGLWWGQPTIEEEEKRSDLGVE